jgi:hypothetical protein
MKHTYSSGVVSHSSFSISPEGFSSVLSLEGTTGFGGDISGKALRIWRKNPGVIIESGFTDASAFSKEPFLSSPESPLHHP